MASGPPIRRRPRPRHPVPRSMSAEKSVVRSVRFSPKEWARVERWAVDARMAPSRYVREAALRRRPGSRPRGVRAEAVTELNRACLDLARLVDLAHQAKTDRAAGRGADPALGGAGGTVTPREVEACLANVLAAIDRVSPPRSATDEFIASDMEPDHPARVAARRATGRATS